MPKPSIQYVPVVLFELRCPAQARCSGAAACSIAQCSWNMWHWQPGVRLSRQRVSCHQAPPLHVFTSSSSSCFLLLLLVLHVSFSSSSLCFLLLLPKFPPLFPHHDCSSSYLSFSERETDAVRRPLPQIWRTGAGAKQDAKTAAPLALNTPTL